MTSSRPDPDPGTPWLSPLSPAALALWWAGGAVLGWGLHRAAVLLDRTPPLVSWSQPVTLLLVAALVGLVAWQTWRRVRAGRAHLRAHQMVNRLALARASAYAGAIIFGGYAGYALSWWGVDVELAGQRALRSVVAAGAGLLLVLVGLALERACRVPGDPDGA